MKPKIFKFYNIVLAGCMQKSVDCINQLHQFCAKASPYSYYKCHVSDIAAVRTTLNVFSYDADWAQNQNSQVSQAKRMHYVLRYRIGLLTFDYKYFTENAKDIKCLLLPESVNFLPCINSRPSLSTTTKTPGYNTNNLNVKSLFKLFLC